MREYRRRFQSLISQTRGAIPAERIPQSQFKRVMESSSNASGRARGSRRTRWTPAQRINGACIGVGVLVTLLVYLTVKDWLDLGGDAGQTLATVSAVLGVAAAAWMKLRARYTGRG